MATGHSAAALAMPPGYAASPNKGHVRFAGTVEAFEADGSLRHEYLSG